MVCSRLTTRRVTIPLCPPLLQTFSPLSILCPLGFPFKFFKDSNRRKKEITNLGFRDLKRHQAVKTAPVSPSPRGQVIQFLLRHPLRAFLCAVSLFPPPSLTGLSVCCLPLPSAVPYGPFCVLSPPSPRWQLIQFLLRRPLRAFLFTVFCLPPGANENPEAPPPAPSRPARLTESRPRDDCLSGTQSAPSWCRPRLGMGRWRCREVP